MAAPHRGSRRAEIRALIQALALDLKTPAVRAFLSRVDRLQDLGDASDAEGDIPCAPAHVAEYGGTVGAAAYLSGSGSDFDDLAGRIAEIAPDLGLEVGVRSPGAAEAWLRRQLEGLGKEGTR